ncbi:acyltransferase family protein [Hoeflea olei]|uniref:Acyltransferase 3 domain-containing protein n=1 Tax=Hoeflea olei TaxID=1480615 RepID=A0A1C1YTD5_9HYPH|nr:acyltransferase [Hoeflea olei]OCW56755.1 hypothetical protein AWJ14_17685 [Hoeflea olei]
MTAPSLPASRPETLYPVQYLRAVSALVVMLFHVSVLSQETWGLDPRRVDHVGAAGVDLFFVISGFIMAMIIDRPGPFDARQFWIRRIARVAPAYWVISLLVFVLAAAVPSLFHSTTADLAHLLASLSFLAVDSGNGSTGPLLVVGWTLNYEIFFYALVALTAGLFGDRRLILAAVAILGAVGAGIVFAPANPSLAFYTDPILLEFVFGILVYRAWRMTEGGALAPLAAFLLGGVLLVAQWERPLVDWRPLFWGVPAAAVLYGGLGVLTFRSRFLARLGDWSYAVYLTHLFVITFYIKYVIPTAPFNALPWMLHYLAMTVLTFAVAAGYFSIVERPLSRWTLRRLDPAARAVAAPAERPAIT